MYLFVNIYDTWTTSECVFSIFKLVVPWQSSWRNPPCLSLVFGTILGGGYASIPPQVTSILGPNRCASYQPTLLARPDSWFFFNVHMSGGYGENGQPRYQLKISDLNCGAFITQNWRFASFTARSINRYLPCHPRKQAHLLRNVHTFTCWCDPRRCSNV